MGGGSIYMFYRKFQDLNKNIAVYIYGYTDQCQLAGSSDYALFLYMLTMKSPGLWHVYFKLRLSLPGLTSLCDTKFIPGTADKELGFF